MGRGIATAALTCALALIVVSAAQAATTIEVTTTEDPAGAGSCPGAPCSLRQAVAFAGEGDTVKLGGSSAEPKVYALTQGATIVIGKSISIEGAGPGATTIDGSANRAQVQFSPRVRTLKTTAGTIDISGIRFTGGGDEQDEAFSGCSPCSTLTANGGGALFNAGATVNLDDVAFHSNTNSPVGGAIGNSATLHMTDVSFSEDGAAFGGGVFSRGTVTGEGVTFEDENGFDYGGGAIFIWSGSGEFVNTTVVGSGTASSRAGGIENRGGNLILRNDTLSGNLRGSLETDVNGASTTVQNTILASGFDDGGVDFNCVASGKTSGAETTTAKAITHDLGNNIDQDGACELSAAGDLTKADPLLAAIADNGGPTRTQALLAGSPAIDAAYEGACPATDQRGVARPQGPKCDIGAFEASPVAPPAIEPVSGTGAVQDRAGSPPPPPSNAFEFGKLKRDKSGVTAHLTVDTPGAGTLHLSGKGVKAEDVTASGAGAVSIPVVTVGKAKKKLKKKGKLALEVTVVFTPTGGTASTQSKQLTLRLPG